jgi:hypothetical protein
MWKAFVESKYGPIVYDFNVMTIRFCMFINENEKKYLNYVLFN